jgi:hypothetical protein
MVGISDEEKKLKLEEKTKKAEWKKQKEIMELQLKENSWRAIVPLTLEETRAKICKWLYMTKDPYHLDIIMAAAIDPKTKGTHLWLLDVGPPSSGKTALLKYLKQFKFFYQMDKWSATALVSGAIDEETREPIGGLLVDIKGKTLVNKDMTLLLQMRYDTKAEILSQLRSLFDDYLDYGYGNTKTRVHIDARIGFLAGVTSVIDNELKFFRALGERFIFYRLRESEEEASRRAIQNQPFEHQMDLDMTEAINGFLKYIQPNLDKEINVADVFKEQIITLASYVALLRTSVKVDIIRPNMPDIQVSETEYRTRLAGQFLKLAKNLALIHDRDEVTPIEMEMVKRVAMDTCPQERLIILKHMKPGMAVTIPTLTTHLQLERIPDVVIFKELIAMYFLGIITPSSRRFSIWTTEWQVVPENNHLINFAKATPTNIDRMNMLKNIMESRMNFTEAPQEEEHMDDNDDFEHQQDTEYLKWKHQQDEIEIVEIPLEIREEDKT